MAQRPPGASAALQWEFPGGKIEPGESPEAALIRELNEELGITAEVGEPLPAVVEVIGGRTLRMTAFAVDTFSGGLAPTEHVALRWITPADFADLDWAPLDIPLLEFLRPG